MRPLAPSDREALVSRWVKLRTAATRAESASAAWNKLNDELMAKWRAEKLDDFAISRIKPTVVALNDLYGTYSFFAGEVQRISADIQAELAYRQLLAMGDDEPQAPVWPAAADRTVPRPSYRPRPYATDDVDEVRLAGLVEPAPLTDPALRDTNSPTGPAHDNPVAGHLHSVSGPVGGKQGAAGAGAPAAPTQGGAR